VNYWLFWVSRFYFGISKSVYRKTWGFLRDILTRFIEIFNFLRGVLRACIRRFGDFMAILINFDNFWQDFWESFFFIVEEVHV
jgi:hypothetical protein